ncbi:MAG: hypothetical protein IKR42_06770, partial [Campylobacter sp.]|nr:hypothetical protein [Campylobacter sp.]
MLDKEIPNSGIIPSDPNGNHLGVIGFGGAITGNVASAKKQVIEFNNLNVTNIQDQKDGLKLRFGGDGYYVFGDVVTAAASVIKTMPGNVITDSPTWEGGYINNGIKGNGIFNSSKAEIKLPKGVIKDDIVFARLYWMGHLYPYGKMGNAGEKISATQLEIPDIKGYQDVKLQIENSKVYDIKRENCQGNFAFVSRRFDDTARGGPRYNMNYTCSADITALVKENFKDYEDEIEIAVGNINANWKNPHYGGNGNGGNMVWSRPMATVNQNPIYSWVTSNTTYRLPFGGWYVVLVYDKTLKSQAELKGDDFPDKDIYGNDIPDNVKFAKARAADIDGDVKTYIDSHFKAKNVTIYDGYLALEPPVPSDFNGKRTKEECAISVDFPIQGFFTPKSGKVQGKLIFGGFGANRGKYTDGNLEGIFVSKTWNNIDSQKLPKNEFHPQAFFNGSKTWLELDDDGNYDLEGETGYHQALDMDEFDISDRLGNSQSELALRLRLLPQDYYITNRVFVPFIGVSIDLYVPNLCYEQKMYDTQGWLGFYKLDGTPITGHPQVEDVKVVTGENLYYRTEIRNKLQDGEDATKVWVKVNTGRSNNYVPNSSGIDNRLELTGLDGLNDAKFVYLQDNTPGAYSTQALRAEGGDPDVASTVYDGKQLNSLLNNELKFYVGRNAGAIGTSGEPVGGDLDKGKSTYIEFNATVGRTFTYTPIKYTVGYAMELAGKVINGPTSIMERCETEENNVKITLLNGLKAVNKNFKDYGDSESDKNKTLAQDDRLYTQIAELPFDINMIFKPDINDIFKDYCVEKDSEGKCNYHTDGFDICANYANIFVKEGNKCRARNYQKLPDGTWGIFYRKGELDGTLQNFPLPGKLYLSAIRSGSGCKYIDNRSKLPFKINGTRYMTDYDTGFMDYQTNNNKKVMPIEKVEFEDAFSGVTFMFSYYPRGISSSNTDTTIFVGDWNSTEAWNYDKLADTWSEVDTENLEEYYIWLQTQMLYEKYIKGFKLSLKEDEKRRLVENWFKNPDNAEAIRKFEEELEEIKVEIKNAKTFFGVEMSPDGSFHVCDSDSFVVRPAYFRADMDAASKYAKLVNLNGDNKRDITEGNVTKHENNYRIGGDYSENTDILSKMIYAVSNKNNPVPNYYSIIGGDLGTHRFRIRNSYATNSLSVNKDSSAGAPLTTAVREVKTYLRPFISSECYQSIENQAFYIEKDLSKQKELYKTLDTCANVPTPYNGFKFENGAYIVDDKAYDYITKDRNNTAKRDLLGRYVDSCKINGQVFDEYYRKVWDKTAISLIADFGLKKIEVTGDGYAKLKRFSQNELVAQGLLEPKDKANVAAAIYTATLYADKNASNPKGPVFNYYNVGDVLVSIYDNSWTDAHGDQTFDERKGPNEKGELIQYWGTTCILNSTSNTPITEKDVRNSGGALSENDIGKVGCDVGMENDQYLVLRYQPEKIEVALAGLNNSTQTITTSDGNITDVYENIRNDFSYTYFNQPDVAFNAAYGIENQALLAPTQLRNLARLNVSADAYISDKVYKNVIATLFDGKQVDVNGTAVAKCGFANEIDLKIIFGFDCQTASGDARCDSNSTRAKTLTQNGINAYNYRPFSHKRSTDGDVLDSYTISIPANTQMYTENECKTLSLGTDSRCFKINFKDRNTEQTTGSFYQLPLPVRYALNLYSDISRNSGLLNIKDSVSGFYNPKADPFKILSTAFDQGKTVTHTVNGFDSKSAKIYVNFDRMHKSPHKPLVIMLNDFDISEASDNNKTITPASFNADFALLDTINNETFTQSVNPTILDFSAYNNKIQRDYNETILDAWPISAYFVYGKANEISNCETIYREIIGTPVNIPILSMIQCGQDNNCTSVAGVPTVFSFLSNDAYRTKGFVVNELDNYSAGNVGIEFVSEYKPEANNIIKTRENLTNNGVENTTYNSQQTINTIVRVLTNPWLIHTPGNSDPQILVDKVGIDNIPQYYNCFKIRFQPLGDWGGHGKRKRDGDVVGNYIVTDDDLNK